MIVSNESVCNHIRIVFVRFRRWNTLELNFSILSGVAIVGASARDVLGSSLGKEYTLIEWTGQRVIMESPPRLGLGTLYISVPCGGTNLSRAHVRSLGMGKGIC